MSPVVHATTRERDPRIAYFDGLADRWDTCGQDPADTLRRLESLSVQLALRAGEDLLEVGCGTGQITGWLATQVSPGRVVAIDFAEAMLEQARRKNVPAEFRCADVCCDGLGEHCFDVILCFHSFPHFRDQPAALRNLACALRRAGRLVVMHLAGRAQINAFHDQVGGAVGGDHLPGEDAWKPLLAHAGLQIRQYEDRESLFFLSAVPSRPRQ
jgi:ubiquinone/menaquinone biosynthesis C-methylase UbiE